jgi:hypothetical protein
MGRDPRGLAAVPGGERPKRTWPNSFRLRSKTVLGKFQSQNNSESQLVPIQLKKPFRITNHSNLDVCNFLATIAKKK